MLVGQAGGRAGCGIGDSPHSRPHAVGVITGRPVCLSLPKRVGGFTEAGGSAKVFSQVESQIAESLEMAPESLEPTYLVGLRDRADPWPARRSAGLSPAVSCAAFRRQ